jgi:hypothetical protein
MVHPECLRGLPQPAVPRWSSDGQNRPRSVYELSTFARNGAHQSVMHKTLPDLSSTMQGGSTERPTFVSEGIADLRPRDPVPARQVGFKLGAFDGPSQHSTCVAPGNGVHLSCTRESRYRQRHHCQETGGEVCWSHQNGEGTQVHQLGVAHRTTCLSSPEMPPGMGFVTRGSTVES